LEKTLVFSEMDRRKMFERLLCSNLAKIKPDLILRLKK